MSNPNLTQKPRIKTTKVVYPQIYSYTLPDSPNHEDSQKLATQREKMLTSAFMSKLTPLPCR